MKPRLSLLSRAFVLIVVLIVLSLYASLWLVSMPYCGAKARTRWVRPS